MLAGVFLAGTAVREWRAGFPAHADRLEHFDRVTRPGSPGPLSGAAAAAPPPAAMGGAAIAAPGASPPPVNLNRASAEELARLPGVSGSLARRIVADRERSGPFASPGAVRRVPGLGPRTLAAIQGLVTTGGAPPPGHAPVAPALAPGRESREAATPGDRHPAERDRRGPLAGRRDR